MCYKDISPDQFYDCNYNYCKLFCIVILFLYVNLDSVYVCHTFTFNFVAGLAMRTAPGAGARGYGSGYGYGCGGRGAPAVPCGRATSRAWHVGAGTGKWAEGRRRINFQPED